RREIGYIVGTIGGRLVAAVADAIVAHILSRAHGQHIFSGARGADRRRAGAGVAGREDVQHLLVARRRAGCIARERIVGLGAGRVWAERGRRAPAVGSQRRAAVEGRSHLARVCAAAGRVIERPAVSEDLRPRNAPVGRDAEADPVALSIYVGRAGQVVVG